jgi:hypothetical protein
MFSSIANVSHQENPINPNPANGKNRHANGRIPAPKRELPRQDNQGIGCGSLLLYGLGEREGRAVGLCD